MWNLLKIVQQEITWNLSETIVVVFHLPWAHTVRNVDLVPKIDDLKLLLGPILFTRNVSMYGKYFF